MAASTASAGFDEGHREAIREYCEFRSQSSTEVAVCTAAELSKVDPGALLDLSDFGSEAAQDARRACRPVMKSGLQHYDACLREQLGAPGVASNTAVAESEISAPKGLAYPPVVDASGTMNSDPIELYEMLSPSVYVVVAMDAGTEPEGMQGSAVAISPDLLMTNCHVVVDAAAMFVGQSEDGIFEAYLVDAHQDIDLCVLRAPGLGANPIHAVRRSSSLQVGEKVMAIGSPSGFINTLSEGVISGLREVDGLLWIQTTAPISPGSSGGGLFDYSGRLVGITTAGQSAGQLNFAVSPDTILSPE